MIAPITQEWVKKMATKRKREAEHRYEQHFRRAHAQGWMSLTLKEAAGRLGIAESTWNRAKNMGIERKWGEEVAV